MDEGFANGSVVVSLEEAETVNRGAVDVRIIDKFINKDVAVHCFAELMKRKLSLRRSVGAAVVSVVVGAVVSTIVCDVVTTAVEPIGTAVVPAVHTVVTDVVVTK
ncbi:hypothetical protein NDU88_007197 [Pleurodeles waltl]|uniref:Uncharacterized protein n=1 Tax=Pleurodeles waltl TaxID=8319 RepID=A0AAV7QM96_PLEWA|nr:hypothetical protein NDU88_007197 [Pleurodeles waltl]